jgi:hypothetical protein
MARDAIRVSGHLSRELKTVTSHELVMTSDGKGCHKSWLQQLEPGSSEEQKRLSCCELLSVIHCNRVV